MKKTVLLLLALALLAGSLAVAATLPGASADASTQLSDTGEYTPFWFDTTTSYICPGDHKCTSNHDCQLYYGPQFYCINPTGARCAGDCVC